MYEGQQSGENGEDRGRILRNFKKMLEIDENDIKGVVFGFMNWTDLEMRVMLSVLTVFAILRLKIGRKR